MLGLVETSIGKMVPIMPEEDRQQDPLLVYAEAYNTLICDALTFRNPIPEVPGLEPRANMRAYVDRKLFVHNLGHACCAYFAFVVNPAIVYLWEAMEDEQIVEATRRAMWESCRALIAAYPDEFTELILTDHIAELLHRFRNRALGDTIFRIGRDLPRKLSREDRLIGALLYDLAHGIGDPIFTAHGVAAGFRFFAVDERGQPFGPDVSFVEEDLPLGIEHVIHEVCGLRDDAPDDVAAANLLRTANTHIERSGPAFLEDLLA
jgi:mannitol-1-phosphate 5-dehydrogenase